MQEMRRHRAGAAIIVALALAGCEVPKEVNPVYIYRAVSGEADAGRPPPPGLDRPRPNLASVPPRPERPPPEVRDAISAALAADRAQSREALLRTGSARPLAGDPAWPAAPPPRAALAAAPAVPWVQAPLPRRAADPSGAPAATVEPAPEPIAPPAIPDFAPPPPPPDLLGQPRRQ